jgi:hypothetical protein
MVPVREAINSGAWFHFSSSDGDMQFRLKVLSFEKLDLSQVDEPQNIDDEETGACWWLMKIEAINLSKQSLFSPLMLREMLLIDQNDFQFNVVQNGHLCCLSEFSKKSGLNRLFCKNLIPKTKIVGAIPFRLPDEDEAEYSLAMAKGTVREA